MKKRMGMVSALVAALALCALPGLAEHHEEEGELASKPYRMVHYDQVAPAMGDAFEAQQRAWVEAFAKAEAGPDWTWWTFQGGFEYITGWAFAEFAELDEDGDAMMAKVVGEETMKKLNEPTGAVIKHHNAIVKHSPEASYDPGTLDPANPGRHFSIGTYWIKPGTEERFMAMAKRIRDAFAKTEQPHGYAVWMVVAGEGTFLVTSFGESAGEYYSRPEIGEILGEAYGAEEAQKLLQEWHSIAVDQKHKDYTYRADLSYNPAAIAEAASTE